MTILLDIDGVLVTTPSWRIVEQEPDGFLKFNAAARMNLIKLINATNASVVITSTHRISYPISKWNEIFIARGIAVKEIKKVNDISSLDKMPGRAAEIEDWVKCFGIEEQYVILDDDLSINKLPNAIKENWVTTKPLVGFDEAWLEKALEILRRK